MDKEVVIYIYIYAVEYYSDIKGNKFELVLMRWMKLEPDIQSEASQKEEKQSEKNIVC